MNPAKHSIKPLFGIIFLDQLYLTLTYPLITLIFFDVQSRLFAADTAHSVRSIWYGLCIALPNIINIFFASTLSALSDEWGRKKILLIEIFSAAIFTLLVAYGIYAGALGFIFAGFIIKGAFSRTNPTALAYIGDHAPKEKKIIYMGYLQLAISLGAATGPILGGYYANKYFFEQLNFAPAFFIAGCLALINTLITFYFLREKHSPSSVSRFLNIEQIKQLCKQPDILRVSLVLLFLQISWSMYYQNISPILKTLKHFDAPQLGWFLGLIACWLALAASIGLYILHKFLRAHHILLVSTYLMIAGFILTLFAFIHPVHPALVWLGALPLAAGDVMAYSCLTAFYSSLAAPHQQGKIMGISFMIVASIWAITAFIGSLLMSIMPVLPLILAPVGTIAALVVLHANIGRQLMLNYELTANPA